MNQKLLIAYCVQNAFLFVIWFFFLKYAKSLSSVLFYILFSLILAITFFFSARGYGIAGEADEDGSHESLEMPVLFHFTFIVLCALSPIYPSSFDAEIDFLLLASGAISFMPNIAACIRLMNARK